MKMIGHDHGCIQLGIRKPVRDFVPYHLDYSTRIIQPYYIIYNGSKQTFIVLCADRHEIHTFLGIIGPLQTDRPSLMFVQVVLQPISLTALIISSFRGVTTFSKGGV
jgi:hypothetical protein